MVTVVVVVVAGLTMLYMERRIVDGSPLVERLLVGIQQRQWVIVSVGVVCKWINKEKKYIPHGKKHSLLIFISEFILCSKLSHGGRTLLVGFIMILYRYL